MGLKALYSSAQLNLNSLSAINDSTNDKRYKKQKKIEAFFLVHHWSSFWLQKDCLSSADNYEHHD